MGVDIDFAAPVGHRTEEDFAVIARQNAELTAYSCLHLIESESNQPARGAPTTL